MFRGGLYARVSTLDQHTIPLQIRACAIILPGGLDDRYRSAGGRFRALQRELREKPLDAARRRRIDIEVLCDDWIGGGGWRTYTHHFWNWTISAQVSSL